MSNIEENSSFIMRHDELISTDSLEEGVTLTGDVLDQVASGFSARVEAMAFTDAEREIIMGVLEERFDEISDLLEEDALAALDEMAGHVIRVSETHPQDFLRLAAGLDGKPLDAEDEEDAEMLENEEEDDEVWVTGDYDNEVAVNDDSNDNSDEGDNQEDDQEYPPTSAVDLEPKSSPIRPHAVAPKNILPYVSDVSPVDGKKFTKRPAKKKTSRQGKVS